eukprot:5007300-Pyramimonas_sp.AAC.1
MWSFGFWSCIWSIGFRFRFWPFGCCSHHAAAGVEVADDVPHVILGRDDVHLHHGLHQLGAALGHALLERRARGNLKRQHRRVHVVVPAVNQSRLQVRHLRESQADSQFRQ